MEIQGIKIAELAEQYGTPCYIYDFNRIKANADRMQQAFQSDRDRCDIFYAMKANYHPAILHILQEMGLGIDAVSPNEVQVALQAGFDPAKILYTGNYESREDLKQVFESGVKINLDSSQALDKLLKLGTPEMISFRINPGKGRGKYEHITTGGDKAKFGLPIANAIQAYKKAQQAGVKRFGIHTFLGGGILDEAHFPEVVELLAEEARKIRSQLNIKFDFFDIGGGFGINYHQDDKQFDIQASAEQVYDVFDKLMVKYDLGTPRLYIEPGRYIVGDAGYLVTTVTSIKESFRKFVGINAGFNILLRPALYGAEHSILIDGKEDLEKTEKVDICGQVCESTDIFTRDRALPPVQVGDLLVFKQAGAYGNTMAMPYNLRMRTAEIGILDGTAKLITRAENLTDFYSRILTEEM